jgi:UDPglucose 6-dehydrogenase
MKLAVVGTGYVGLVAAAGFCELGHQVICVDNDVPKLQKLRAGVMPFYEEHLKTLVRRHSGKRLKFSTDLGPAVRDSDVIFIAVGTPEGENGEADLSYVEAVSREIATAIRSYKVIVEKSTVPVYTNRWIRRSMLLNGAPADLFEVVSNPEFLREGRAVVDFLFPDRILIGGDSERSISIVRSIYSKLENGTYYRELTDIPVPANFTGKVQVIETSTASAELIKHASNAFLAMKVSFINAVSTICEAVGADVGEVASGIGADPRIGDRFLQPGIGYGGSCFPKDLKAFRAAAKEIGYDFRLLDEIASINEEQRMRFLRKVRGAVWTLKGKKIGALGLSFKAGTDDIRESPAIPILRALIQEGCRAVVYDPVARERGEAEFASEPALSFASSAYEAANGADALLVLTDWPEFSQLDLGRIRNALKYHLLIDGRNMFDPEEVTAKGLAYISMGRPDAFPDDHPVGIGVVQHRNNYAAKLAVGSRP